MRIINGLTPVATPFLAVAPKDYSAVYHDQLSNILRLYFNQIGSNNLNTLLGPQGGQHLNFPLGAFYDTTDQYDGATTVPYAMRFNSTNFSYGVTVEPRLVVADASIATTTMTVTNVLSGRFYPGMLLSGTGVSAGSYVYLQLSSTATAVATKLYASGGAVGATTVVLNSVTNIEPLQFVSGTGVPANTRVIYVDYNTNTVTLSAAFTVQAAGSYSFSPWGYTGTYSVSPSQTVSSTQISGRTDSKLTVAQPGIYNVQFSAQFSNTDNNVIHEVDVWFRKNGVDIPDSNSRFSIPGTHSGLTGQLIAALNFFVEMAAGDYIEIVWHTDSSTVFIETVDAATNPIRPITPSTIVTLTFVSTSTTA